MSHLQGRTSILIRSQWAFCKVTSLNGLLVRCMGSHSKTIVSAQKQKEITVLGNSYPVDECTNITPLILKKVGTNLHMKNRHPIGLIKLQIQDYFYKHFVNGGSPVFSMYDSLSPVVMLEQNFDNLLVPKDHVSRKVSESYYLNSSHMLRAHTTAHQRDLISSGLDCFLIVGDVYRRDTVDASHYPVFHQIDGVRLFNKYELFQGAKILQMFDDSKQSEWNQAGHTFEASFMVQHNLKSTLENLALSLFGKNAETRWVDAYFPFTHPSFELEVKHNNEWMELLGCGVIEQEILKKAGAGDKIGWAFGMGLERLAIKLYSIPDIRLFWSEDPRFLSQFDVDDANTKICFTPFSKYPPCLNDISFFIPENFHENDFYDLVRSVGGDLVEQVNQIDVFCYSKHNKTSHCYRITYRHTERVLTHEEVNQVHKTISAEAVKQLGVQIR